MTAVKKGDRVSVDAKRVGQPRRGGVVTAVTEGLAGTRYTVSWDDGTETSFSPQFGNLVVEGRAKAGGKAKATGKKKTKDKASKASGSAKAAGGKKKTTKATKAKTKAKR